MKMRMHWGRWLGLSTVSESAAQWIEGDMLLLLEERWRQVPPTLANARKWRKKALKKSLARIERATTVDIAKVPPWMH